MLAADTASPCTEGTTEEEVKACISILTLRPTASSSWSNGMEVTGLFWGWASLVDVSSGVEDSTGSVEAPAVAELDEEGVEAAPGRFLSLPPPVDVDFLPLGVFLVLGIFKHTGFQECRTTRLGTNSWKGLSVLNAV